MKKQRLIYKFGHSRILQMPYCLYLPNGYDPQKTYPLIVFLHGVGERGDGSLDRVDLVEVHGIPHEIAGGKEVDAIVLAPQCPAERVWNHLTDEVKELIDSVMRAHPIDCGRVSLAGVSMGGYGTWEMGMSYPGFFSALLPVCGGGLGWRVERIGKTPVWAIHGDADEVVPLHNSLELCDRLRGAGGNVTLTVLHDVGHDCMPFIYDKLDVCAWLTSQHR